MKKLDVHSVSGLTACAITRRRRCLATRAGLRRRPRMRRVGLDAPVSRGDPVEGTAVHPLKNFELKTLDLVAKISAKISRKECGTGIFRFLADPAVRG